jgi:hypothetical protein
MGGDAVIDPAAWRDVDNEGPEFGMYVTRHGATFLVGRRCYRIRWTGPWTR